MFYKAARRFEHPLKFKTVVTKIMETYEKDLTVGGIEFTFKKNWS